SVLRSVVLGPWSVGGPGSVLGPWPLRDPRAKDPGQTKNEGPGTKGRHGFFLRSALMRDGDFNVIVTPCFCSPRSGWRNVISCGPIGSDTLPSGVSPIFAPSTNTSAHGSALIDAVPVGQLSAIGATLPGGTCTVRTT